MRNPRIYVNDDVWRMTRARAAGEGKSTSQVVEDALGSYLAGRGQGMTQGSVIPEFTGAVNQTDLTGNLEVPLHGVEVRTDPVEGFQRVQPAPKPSAKKRGAW